MESEMADDADWVAEVRRWVMSGATAASDPAMLTTADDGHALGVEAAHPALQAAHWPDAPDDGVSDRR